MICIIYNNLLPIIRCHWRSPLLELPSQSAALGLGCASPSFAYPSVSSAADLARNLQRLGRYKRRWDAADSSQYSLRRPSQCSSSCRCSCCCCRLCASQASGQHICRTMPTCHQLWHLQQKLSKFDLNSNSNSSISMRRHHHRALWHMSCNSCGCRSSRNTSWIYHWRAIKGKSDMIELNDRSRNTSTLCKGNELLWIMITLFCEFLIKI